MYIKHSLEIRWQSIPHIRLILITIAIIMSVSYNVIKGSASKKLVETSVSAELESHQVYIETTHSGLCGTDEHYLGADQALGHEGVGIVRQVGSGVKSIKVGQRVGFGYTHEVCANCQNCCQGKPNLQKYIM